MKRKEVIREEGRKIPLLFSDFLDLRGERFFFVKVY
jgi:hypothetical protein